MLHKILGLVLIISNILIANYTLSEKSSIQFFAEHLGKENVVGTFSSIQSEINSRKLAKNKDDIITILNKKPVTLSLSIDSLSTNNKVRDKHLKSRVFFNEKKHPTLSFITKNSLVTLEDKVTINGDLNIKQTSVPLTLETKLTILKVDPKSKEILEFSLENQGNLSRKNHDLGFYKKMINDTIKTKIKLIYIKN